MSNVRGKISIDVQFADSTSASGVQSLKTITLQDTQDYSTGKVAIVSGTVGTAIDGLPLTGYRNASGATFTFTTISRIALVSPTQVNLSLGITQIAVAKNNQLTITSNPLNNDLSSGFSIRAFSGTASYTAVCYGA